MYANPFTKVMILFGCQLTSKIIGIGPSERNCNYYKHFQHVKMSRLQSDLSENQAILDGADNVHKNSIMGTRCV